MTRTFFIFILMFLLSSFSMSQSILLHEAALLEHEFAERLEIKSGSFSDNIFTSIKPFSRKETVKYLEYADTAIEGLSHTDREIMKGFFAGNPEWVPANPASNESPFFRYFYEYPGDFFSYEEEGFFLALNPVINLHGNYQNTENNFTYINQRGVKIRGLINERIGFYSFIADNQAAYPVYVEEKISQQAGAVPGEGWYKTINDDGYDFFSVKGYFNFKLLPNVDVQFGQDKNMIGNGMRSLFLSNYSNNYLFLKLNTQFNRFHYQNIFAELIDYPMQTYGGRRYDRKFSTTHYLTARITNNFRLGLFENVTYGRSDSLNQRALETYYLNPIIFYRAVEHQVGDPDKVAIGLDWQWLIASKLSFYGQIYVDDFSINEVRKDLDSLMVRAGLRDERKYDEFASFQNKFGLQTGIKWIDLFGVSNLDMQLEANLVRPFTYTHFDSYGLGHRPSASYTHYSQALAHPLGANFSEQAARISYRTGHNLAFSLQAFNYKHGEDIDGINYGGDILRNYSTRQGDYDNYFLQGNRVDVTLLDFMVSWEFYHNIFIDASTMLRTEKKEINGNDKSDMFFSISLRWKSFPVKHYF